MNKAEGRCYGRHGLVAVVSVRARVYAVALVMAVLPVTVLVVAAPASAGNVQTSAAAAPARSALPSSPEMSACPSGMARKEGTGFIIWACDDGSAGAALNQAYTAVSGVWGTMTSLMGQPLPDAGGIAGGGPGIPFNSPKAKWIDIYLLYPAQVLKREGHDHQLDGDIASEQDDNVRAHPPSGYKTASGFLMLDRERLAAPGFKSDFVHEFFHVLQSHWNTGACGAGYNWFVEASATWAETYFANATAKTEVYDPRFTAFEKNPGTSLLSNSNLDPYHAFIWPFFMQQHGGGPGIVARAWHAMAGQATCAKMDQAISSALPFQKYFGEFALENFDAKLPNIGNKALLQWPERFQSMYQQVDHKFPEMLPKESPLKNPAGNTATSQKVSVADLATRYDQWQTGLGNYMLSIEFNFSGIINRKNLDITAVAAEKNQYSASRPFLVIPVQSNYLRICAPADSPKGDLTRGIVVHLIFANHSIASGGTVGGSYTVTPRTTCAASASGTYTETLSQTSTAGYKYNDTVTLKNANFFPTSQYLGWTLDLTKGTYTYSGTDGSGSGPLSDIVQNPQGAVVIPTIFAWDIGSYRNQPSLSISSTEFQTSSGKILRVEGGICPLSGPWSYGKYINNFHAVDFTCSDSNTVNGFTTKTSASGTIQAVDPIHCGIWGGSGCPVTVAARDTISAGASG
jgi:hypothetical protein